MTSVGKQTKANLSRIVIKLPTYDQKSFKKQLKE